MPLCRVVYPNPTAIDVQKEEVHLGGAGAPGNSFSEPNSIEQLFYLTSRRLSQTIGNLSKVADNVTVQLTNFSDLRAATEGDGAASGSNGVSGEERAADDGKWGLLNEMQLIKAVVLMVVVSLLLLSTCTVIFRTFSVFSGKKDDLQM